MKNIKLFPVNRKVQYTSSAIAIYMPKSFNEILDGAKTCVVIPDTESGELRIIPNIEGERK